MPPPLSQLGGGPSRPWKQTLNVTFLKSSSTRLQKLKFSLKLSNTYGMCPDGATFTITHVPKTDGPTALFSFALPPQLNPASPSAGNFEFTGVAMVDLKLGKQFQLDWTKCTSRGGNEVQESFEYPVNRVHA
ncbi:MAG: hypothetical protein EAZ43_14020 [Betaproteobacteria bacterium]|nr:MAG: hypothetical protein EAZ43_14020 [Betaproteobacteria bacterium]